MRRTAAAAARTRGGLVEAGAAYFRDHPYDEVALEDVAAELGVTRGAIYHHFGSKRDFFIAVVEKALADLRDQIVTAAGKAGSGWKGVAAGCNVFLAAGADEKFRRIVLVDAPAVLGRETWTAIDDRTTGASLRAALDNLAAAGAVATEDVEALTVGISGAINELSLWVASQPSNRKALTRAQAIVSAMLTAFQA